MLLPCQLGVHQQIELIVAIVVVTVVGGTVQLLSPVASTVH